jgi:hypothetical protein
LKLQENLEALKIQLSDKECEFQQKLQAKNQEIDLIKEKQDQDIKKHDANISRISKQVKKNLKIMIL